MTLVNELGFFRVSGSGISGDGKKRRKREEGRRQKKKAKEKKKKLAYQI